MGPFSKKEHNFSVLVSVALLCASIVQILLSHKPDSTTLAYMRFVSYIVFGNATHVALTFVMVVSVPEVKRWLSLKSFELNRKIVLASLFFFAGGMYLEFQVKGYNSRVIVNAMRILWLMIPAFHGIRQNYGIVQMYNAANPPSEKRLKFERQIFWILTSIVTIQSGLLLCEQKKLITLPTYQLARLLTSGSFIILSLLLIKNIKHQKNQFLLRLFLFPLGYYSSIAALGVGMLHGLEYYMVFKKIVGSSVNKYKSIMTTSTILIFGVLTCGFLAHPSFGLPAILVNKWNPDDYMIRLMFILLATVTYLHYYFDALIFKMRDPVTRKMISPLINKTVSAS